MRNRAGFPLPLDRPGITTKAALSALFEQRRRVPAWQGVSGDACWDCLVAGVPRPPGLRLENGQEFAAAGPRDLEILRQVQADDAPQMPGHRLGRA